MPARAVNPSIAGWPRAAAAAALSRMILDLPDGATVEILTPVGDGLPCVMRGTIPAGGIVPLHSHADPETFLMLDGEIEGFVAGEWSRIAAGDVLHVPGHIRHAWRNRRTVPADMLPRQHRHDRPLLPRGRPPGPSASSKSRAALRLLERDAGGERRDRPHSPCSSAPLTLASSAFSR